MINKKETESFLNEETDKSDFERTAELFQSLKGLNYQWIDSHIENTKVVNIDVGPIHFITFLFDGNGRFKKVIGDN